MQIILRWVPFFWLALAASAGGAFADKVCGKLETQVKAGSYYHGAKCNSAKPCNCTAKECIVDVTLPATGQKSKQTQYSDASCVPVPGDTSGPSSGSKTCGVVEAQIQPGKFFHGAACKGSSSCNCKADECAVQVTLPSTGQKSVKTTYANAVCEPIKPSSSPFPNTYCKTITKKRDYGQCFLGPCCLEKKGCTCSAKQCGPKSAKNVGEIKYSDIECKPNT